MLAPWTAQVTLITLRDLGIKLPGSNWNGVGNKVGPLPSPADYLATFALFAPLAFLSDNPTAHNFAELMAWAIVLATFMGAVNPSVPLSKGGTTAAPQSGSAQVAA
jgi:hypothetical protein